MGKITDPLFPLATSIQLSDKLLGVVGGLAKNISLSLLKTLIGTTVEDSLTSDSATNAVSVHQAKLLNDALANKLDASAYNDHYKGTHTTIGQLQTAHPTANAGDYAIVDAGSGQDAHIYLWDVQDGWVQGSATSLLNTDGLAEGSNNKYFSDLRVRNAILTGLSLATNAAITASDNVLSAFGKLQKQITDLTSTVSGKFDSANVPYTFNEQTGTSYTVVASDVTTNGRVIITCTNAAAIAVTLNTPSSYGASVGSSFNICQGGAGVLTITGAGGATLIGTATTSAINETKTLIAKTSTSWKIVGG